MLVPLTVQHRGRSLIGSADLPARPAREGILLLHGFTGSRVEYTYLFVHLARLLNARGIAVFRFDFAGCGESEGDFADLSIADQAEQAGAMLDCVQADYPDLRWHVLGFSMGALAATLAAGRRAELASLLLLAPAGNMGGNLKPLALQPSVPGGYDYLGLTISDALLKEAEAFDLGAAARQLHLPTLVLHGADDVVVPARIGEAVAAQIPGGGFQGFAQADHVFARIVHRQQLATAIADWVEQRA